MVLSQDALEKDCLESLRADPAGWWVTGFSPQTWPAFVRSLVGPKSIPVTFSHIDDVNDWDEQFS